MRFRPADFPGRHFVFPEFERIRPDLAWGGRSTQLLSPGPPSNDIYDWVISVNERGDHSGEFVTAYICNSSASICDNTGNYDDPYGDALGTSFSDGGPVTFTEVSATPEPATGILVLVGFGLIVGRLRMVKFSSCV